MRNIRKGILRYFEEILQIMNCISYQLQYFNYPFAGLKVFKPFITAVADFLGTVMDNSDN